jgi:hypothetical protein
MMGGMRESVWVLLELNLLYYETAMNMNWAMRFIVSVLSNNYT